LGDASYALYLVHLIVLVALQRPLAGWPWQLAASLMFVTCIVAALASYRFIERPILHWIRARSVRRREALA
jgi:peptidoglycan/LPS O-acetylase OafA/YrhL